MRAARKRSPAATTCVRMKLVGKLTQRGGDARGAGQAVAGEGVLMALSGLDGAVGASKRGGMVSSADSGSSPAQRLNKDNDIGPSRPDRAGQEAAGAPSPVCTSSAISSAPCSTLRWHRVSTWGRKYAHAAFDLQSGSTRDSATTSPTASACVSACSSPGRAAAQPAQVRNAKAIGKRPGCISDKLPRVQPWYAPARPWDARLPRCRSRQLQRRFDGFGAAGSKARAAVAGALSSRRARRPA